MKSTQLTATDQFCGAGGSTTGLKDAGVDVRMALNHWKLAIETHNSNHPEVDHDCTDIQACDPRKYPSTNILVTSPECTNHSLAKGAKRKHQAQLDLFGKVELKAEEERSRATMWDVPRFAEYHNYDAIIVENVVDARYWRMWEAWLMAMHLLGYKHECAYLNSQFFEPCPQSRDRMYVVFWKKGNRAPDLNYRPLAPCGRCGDQEAFQSFKAGRRYGKYNQQYIYRCSGCNEVVTPYYYAALNCIDWSIPIKKISERKKPLAEKTMERIRHGIEKYAGQQLIISSGYRSGLDCRVKSAHSQPLPTQPGSQRHFLLSCRPGQEATVTPSIVELRRTGKCKSLDNALPTVTAGGINHGLLVGNYSPGWTRPLSEPCGTMTTTAQQAIVSSEAAIAFLSYYYGSGNQTSSLSAPTGTVTTKDRMALCVTPAAIEDCYYRCLKAKEVQAAMAFPGSYQVMGNVKEQVKQLGNAVTPPVMRWLSQRVIDSLEKS